MSERIDENTVLFTISTAAELSGLHPQTLRQYDRIGLVMPTRTAGKSRRYTLRDVAQLREIHRLSELGVSLEGIRRVVELENEANELRKRVTQLETALADVIAKQDRTFAAGTEGEIVAVAKTRRKYGAAGRSGSARGEVVVWHPRRWF